jgi:hypothetical protein
MKKTTLLTISVILYIAVVLMLAGCEQPTFTAGPTTGIESPVLEAETLPGAVLLSWDPVADVQTYKLYRKSAADNLPIVLNPSGNYYLDRVDFNNTLKNGGSYTYTLEAVARGSVPLTSALSEPKTVTADIPARTPTIVTAPAASAVTLTPLTLPAGTNPDRLEVYWEQGKAALPFSYLVEYIYGDGQALPFVYSSSSSLTGDIYAKQALFPLVGGNSTVKITANWGSSNYYAPASVTKTHTGAPTVLPAVSYVSTSGTPVNGSLILTWDVVTGAAGYDVYKAEISSGGPSSNGFVSSSNALAGAVIGAYSTITPNAGDTMQDGNYVYFTDAGYDSAKKWLYIVIAKNAGIRSSAPALYVQIPGAPSLSSGSLTVSAFQDSAAGDDVWKASVIWNRAEGETYTLYRAPLEFANDGYTVTSVGAYTAIPAASLSDKDGRVIYIDTVGTGQLSLGQSYRYKVIAVKDGASAEYTDTLTSAPFSRFISGAPSVTTTGASYGQFKVKPYEPSYFNNLSYELYAAESDGTRLTSGWTQITLGTPDTNGYYTWTAPDTRKRYVFSQDTKFGAVTLVNNNASTPTFSPYVPKLAASSSFWGISPGLLGQDDSNVVISLGSALTEPATPPANWWLEQPAYQNLFGAKIYRAAEKNDTTIARTSLTTVRFNATNAAITVNTASVPAWSFYIVLPRHHTIPAADTSGSETWYFGTEYNSGYGPSGFTNDKYYTINKSGTAITVSAVN